MRSPTPLRGWARFQEDIAHIIPKTYHSMIINIGGYVLSATLILAVLFLPTFSQVRHQEQQRLLELSLQLLSLKPSSPQLQQFCKPLSVLDSARLRFSAEHSIDYGDQDWSALDAAKPTAQSLILGEDSHYFYSIYQDDKGQQVYLKIYATRYYAQMVQRIGLIFITIILYIFIGYWLYRNTKNRLQLSVRNLTKRLQTMQDKKTILVLNRQHYKFLNHLVDRINCLIKYFQKQLEPENTSLLETQYNMAEILVNREVKLQKNLDFSHLHLQQLVKFVPDDKKDMVQLLRQQNKENRKISQYWQQFFQLEQSYLSYHNEVFDLVLLQENLLDIYEKRCANVIRLNRLPSNYFVSANPYQIRFILRQLLQAIFNNTSKSIKISWDCEIDKGKYQFNISTSDAAVLSQSHFEFYHFDGSDFFHHHPLGIARRLAQHYRGNLRFMENNGSISGLHLSLYLAKADPEQSIPTFTCWKLAPTKTYQALILTDEPIRILSLQQRLYYLGFTKVLVQAHHQTLQHTQHLDIVFSDSLSNLELDAAQVDCPLVLTKDWKAEKTAEGYGFKTLLLPPFSLKALQICLETYLDADFLPCTTQRIKDLYPLMSNMPLPHLNAVAYQRFNEAARQADKESLVHLINQINVLKWQNALHQDLQDGDFIALMDKVRYLYLD